jgi:hypothetical protein
MEMGNTRFERKEFFCGTKPSGVPLHKFGWVAHLPNGRVIGDETVNRGLYGHNRWEPRYLTRADIAGVVGAV